MPRVTFDARGQWLATSFGQTTIEFWPVSNPRRRALRGFASTIWSMAFTPDGRWLAACSMGEAARLWPLNPTVGGARNLVPQELCMSIKMHPQDSQVLVSGAGGKVLLVPTEGGRPRQLLDRRDRPSLTHVAFDRQGRRAVAVRTYEGLLRAWDLPSGRERVYSIPHLTDADWSVTDFAFAPDGRLYVAGQAGMGVRRLALPAETEGTVSSETLFAAGSTRLDLSRDGRLLLVLASQTRETTNAQYEELRLFDLAENTSRGITTHGSRLAAAVLSPSGRSIVTGDIEGAVRVGPASGKEPHLLFGHKGPVSSLAVSPDERWIASASDDAVYLWPMPDVTKPPLHALPHAELMAKLDALTNLRVVRDPSSSTGWKLDIGPFPGWKDVPTW